MKKSFKDSPEEVAEESTATPAVQDSEALAAIEGGNTALAIPDGGGFDMRDIQLPYLTIAQGSGDLVKEYEAGSLVIKSADSDHFKLAAPDVPVTMVVTELSKYYEEKTPFQPDKEKRRAQAPAKTWATRDEMIAAGFVCDYEPGKPSTATEVGQMTVLVEAPEGADSTPFFLKIGDRRFCPCKWTVRSTGYRYCPKTMFNKRVKELAEPGLRAGNFRIVSERRKSGDWWVFVPVTTLLPELNSPEFVAEITAKFGM